MPIIDKLAATVARAVANKEFVRNKVQKQLHNNCNLQYERELFVALCLTFKVNKTQQSQTDRRPTANVSVLV